MNIPKGWPTYAMLLAAVNSGSDGTFDELTKSFKAMLAAAPTPPAPKNPWKDAIAFECEAVNVPFNEESPDDTLMRLMNHYEWMEREGPPAQEDEPVGYVSLATITKLRDGHDSGFTVQPRKGIIYSEPIYTRPQS